MIGPGSDKSRKCHLGAATLVLAIGPITLKWTFSGLRSRGGEDDGGHDNDDYDEEEDEVDNNVVGMLRNELEEEVTARASPT